MDITADQLIEKLREISASGHGGEPVLFWNGYSWVSPVPVFNPDDEGDFIELTGEYPTKVK